MPRIHRGARDDPPARAHSQQPLHRIDGSIHAQMAVPTAGAKPLAGSSRDLGILKRLDGNSVAMHS